MSLACRAMGRVSGDRDGPEVRWVGRQGPEHVGRDEGFGCVLDIFVTVRLNYRKGWQSSVYSLGRGHRCGTPVSQHPAQEAEHFGPGPAQCPPPVLPATRTPPTTLLTSKNMCLVMYFM